MAIWLSTTASQESTRFPYVQVACDMLLKSSWWGLQLWFRPRFNRRFAPEVIVLQSRETPNLSDFVVTPLWGKCGDETHTPKSGNLESFETFATSELDCRGQNTLPWGVLYTVGKVSKCRCRKWPHMGHLDICSTSYGQKKGRESNWQFASRPQKVGNRPDPEVFKRSATHRWKALEKNYKFSSDLAPIRGLSRKLWPPKVPGVQTETVGAGAVEQCIEYYMGEGGGFPRIRAMVSQVSPRSPVACPNTKRVQNEL